MDTQKNADSGRQTAKLTIRAVCAISFFLYLINIIPLLILGHFNYASADDFSEGRYARAVWLATGSIPKVLASAVGSAWRSYFNWMGYYGYMFFGSITPVVFSEKVYRITPWIMLGLLTFSCICLLQVLLGRILGCDRTLTLALSFLLLLLSVECMMGANEMIYWYGGAVNYTLFYAFGQFLMALLLSAAADFTEEKKGRARTMKIVTAAILAFFTAGGNYLTALSVALEIAAMLAILGIGKKLKACRPILIPCIVYYVGFALSVLAPGNQVRAAMLEGFGPVKTIMISLYYFFDVLINQMTTWPVLLGLLLFLPLFWKLAETTEFNFPYPVLVLLFFAGLAAANFAPPIYAEGNVEAGRLQATLFLQYVFLAFLAEFYAVGWLRRHLLGKTPEDIFPALPAAPAKNYGKEFSEVSMRGIACTALLILFASAMGAKVNPYMFTTTAAVYDLQTGTAQAYAQEQEARLAILKDPSVREAVLPAFRARPFLLYYTDGIEDPGDWTNYSIAQFYGKDKVIVIHNLPEEVIILP